MRCIKWKIDFSIDLEHQIKNGEEEFCHKAVILLF